MQSQTLSPELNRALHQIVNYRTPQFRNEDIRMIFTNLLERENFGLFFSEVQPQVDRVFDFIQCATEEYKNMPGAIDAPAAPDGLSEDPNTRLPFRAVIDWIVALLSPACIYHLSGGTTENDVIDLIIVLHHNEKKTFNACEGLINVLNANHRIVNFTLFKLPQLHKYIQDGSIFYTEACRPERLVYHNCLEQITLPSSCNLALLKSRAGGIFEAGYHRGMAFLKGADSYIKDNQKEMAAFMLQQAAEMTLRAAELSVTGIDIRNHSIEVLLKYCSRFAPRLTTLFPRNSPEECHLFVLLEAAYLKARYTDEFVVTTVELLVLKEKISRLLDMACARVRQLINDFEPGTNICYATKGSTVVHEDIATKVNIQAPESPY